jgi:hypothetical protein
MALTAVLEIGDNTTKLYYKQYMLTDLRLVFNRSYKVVPTGIARCERMELTVVAPGKDDLFMFDWFLRSTSISGRIVITLNDEDKGSDSNSQVIFFEDAYCFSMSEKYDIDNSRRRLLKMAMVSEKIDIKEVTFKCI